MKTQVENMLDEILKTWRQTGLNTGIIWQLCYGFSYGFIIFCVIIRDTRDIQVQVIKPK